MQSRKEERSRRADISSEKVSNCILVSLFDLMHKEPLC